MCVCVCVCAKIAQITITIGSCKPFKRSIRERTKDFCVFRDPYIACRLQLTCPDYFHYVQ